MLTVSHDLGVVESELVAGRLACPGCAGSLRGWGWARSRVIRHGAGVDWHLVRHHPRRARCRRCGATHVLLPVLLAARRADAAGVIAAAVEAKVAGGEGHRVVAARLARPATTVRGWLRAFTGCAGMITQKFTALSVGAAPDVAGVWPRPAMSAAGDALSVLMGYAGGLGRRFGAVVTVAWVQAGLAACNGWLFCRGWWVRGSQHETTLMPGPVGPEGCQ